MARMTRRTSPGPTSMLYLPCSLVFAVALLPVTEIVASVIGCPPLARVTVPVTCRSWASAVPDATARAASTIVHTRSLRTGPPARVDAAWKNPGPARTGVNALAPRRPAGRDRKPRRTDGGLDG